MEIPAQVPLCHGKFTPTADRQGRSLPAAYNFQNSLHFNPAYGNCRKGACKWFVHRKEVSQLEFITNLVSALQGFTVSGLSTLLAHVPLAVGGVGILCLLLVFPFRPADVREDILRMVKEYVQWAKVARGK
ncbi:hypothetical protein ACIRFF_34945 [Streptomyces cyaneofuscatus]